MAFFGGARTPYIARDIVTVLGLVGVDSSSCLASVLQYAITLQLKTKNVVVLLRYVVRTRDNTALNDAARSPALPNAPAAVAPKALPAEHSLQSSQGCFLE